MTDQNNNAAGQGITRRRALAGVGMGLFAASPFAPRPARAAEPVHLTIWSWVPNMQDEAKLYEQANPGVTVSVVNVGQGNPHYAKIEDALRARSGGPDLAQIEFDKVLTFRELHAFSDLAPYGVNAFKADYVPWAWQQVIDGEHVYALPWDSGPIGQIYRKDIFDSHGLTAALTWDAFAEQALKLHKDAPDRLLTNATFSEGGWSNALLWQMGWRPFHVDGTTIGIDVSNDISRRFSAYWQKLLDVGAVDAKPGFVTEWYEAFDKGRYANWIVGAWGPLFLEQFAKTSAGNWRAAAIPQWQAGSDPVSANWGGSTLALLKQSPHQAEAAKLAIWLLHNSQSTRLFATKQYLFPTSLALLNDKSFLDTPYPFYGNQPVNQVFAASAKQVDSSFQWSPFQEYVQSQMGTELVAAANGRGTLASAFDRLQHRFVSYAREQGFTVET